MVPGAAGTSCEIEKHHLHKTHSTLTHMYVLHKTLLDRFEVEHLPNGIHLRTVALNVNVHFAAVSMDFFYSTYFSFVFRATVCCEG